MNFLLLALADYFLGSIPTGYLVGRLNGLDIREHGSRNIGATNVLRVLGKKWGIPVFFADFLKGLLAVLIARWWMPDQAILAGIGGAISCILGHNFPVWLRFKGGKGIATSAGVLVALMPLVILVMTIAWAAVFFTTRYVSLASITGAGVLPIAAYFIYWNDPGRTPLLIFSLIIAGLAIWRHRANIQRLVNGTENRFEKKRKPSS